MSSGRREKYGGSGGRVGKPWIAPNGHRICGISRSTKGFCPLINGIETCSTDYD